MKNVDIAVYNYLKTVADGLVKAGISTATLQNGGVLVNYFVARILPTDTRSSPAQSTHFALSKTSLLHT
jgi:basic membrane lipoprotein Med (substrate-binding protein (PBP1-ABC) superfamily)